MIVDCAVYEQGRARGRAAGGSRCRGGRERTLRLDRLHERQRTSSKAGAGVDLHEAGREDAIHAHQRPSSRCTARPCRRPEDGPLRGSSEVVEFGEIPDLHRGGVIITVRPARPPTCMTCASVWREPDCSSAGPEAVLHAIVDRVVDDYLPALEGSSRRDRGRGASLRHRPRTTRPSALRPQARGARVPPGGHDSGGNVSAWQSGEYALIHTNVRPTRRREATTSMRVRDQLEASATCITSVLQANLGQVTVRQNSDMRRIRPGWRSSPCPR